MTDLYVGLVAALLQIAGYVFYIRNIFHKEEALDPNPTSWLMWAYGMALLTILEADLRAPLAILFLPGVCTLLSIYIAVLCWRREKIRWPEHYADALAFCADLIITILYLGVWWLFIHGNITEEGRGTWVIIFLLLSNATTITSFIPQLRQVYLHRGHERALPWLTWMLAYAALFIATAAQTGVYSVLLVYPGINFVIHGYTAWLVRPGRVNKPFA